MKRFLISFQLYKLQRKKVVPLFIFQGNNIFVRKEGKVFEGESKVQAEIFFSVWNVRFFIFLTKKTLLTKVYFILSHMKKISSPESSFFYLVSQMKELNLKLCHWLFWYNLFTHVKTNMKTNSPDFVFSPQETSRFLSTNSHDRRRENYFSQTETVLDLSLRASVLKKHFSWLSVCLKSKHK